MAVVEMMGISLIGPREEIEPLAAELLTLGNFEPVPLEYALEKRPAALAGAGRSRIATFGKNPYDTLLETLLSVWKAAGAELPTEEPRSSYPRLSFEEAKAGVQDTAKKILIWKKRAEALEEEREKLLAAAAFLDALAAADRDVEETLKTQYLHITFGRLSADNYRRLKEMAAVTPLLVYPVVAEKGNVLAVIFCSKEYQPDADKLFRSVYLKEYSLAEMFEGAGQDMLGRLRERVRDSDRAIRGLQEAPKNHLDRHRTNLENLYYAVSSLQRVYALCQKRGELSGILVLSGVVPAPTLSQIEGVVEKFGPNTLFLTEKAAALEKRGKKLPTLLKNNFFVRSFQEIVSLYSLPSYGETDPSAFVALSFCLFFGFMFGDVGHGFLLALGAWYLQKRGILKKGFASVIRMAGYSAMVFGFLYGSVFGSENLLPSLWISPMEGISNLIATSLFVGVVFLSLGILLNIIALHRKGQIGKMLFDGEGITGLLFYWVAALSAAMVFTGSSPPKALYFLLGGLFLVILFSSVLDRAIFGPRENEEGGVVHTFTVFHGLLSFLSNTASFVRLAAFAMNHAGLSAAVFMLSDMVHSLPGGPFFQTMILVVGNLVIVGLEGLIVFIQTLRLEYYEFFSKFFRGGGHPFTPVTWNRKPND
ncbi:MAG: ATPase [Synergistaceae bacterium]|nr:ATPase [Synergistaceae bacterium]